MAPRRSSVHFLLLVIAFAANAALAPCGGWQASAKARMACCAEATPQCSQADADDCCVAGEQRQHGEMFASIAQPVVPVQSTTLEYVNTAPVAHSRVGHLSRSARPLGSPPDTHLLLSVFLI